MDTTLAAIPADSRSAARNGRAPYAVNAEDLAYAELSLLSGPMMRPLGHYIAAGKT